MAEGNWVLSYRLAQYLCKSEAAVRASGVRQRGARTVGAGSDARTRTLETRERPVPVVGTGGFLLGQNLDAQYDTSLAPLVDLGLNLAVYMLNPAQPLPDRTRRSSYRPRWTPLSRRPKQRTSA